MAVIDTLISVLSSFVVFSYLGALASRMNVPVTKVVEEGTLHLFYTFTVLRLYQKRQICRSCALHDGKQSSCDPSLNLHS